VYVDEVPNLCDHASDFRRVGHYADTPDLIQPQADQCLALASMDFSLRALVAATPYWAVDLLDLDITHPQWP
jgi:hypothetical protein